MSDVEYLARSIKQIAAYEASKYRTSITFGTVVDIDSDGGVTIELINGFIIGGAQLVLSMFCVERTIHIPYDESSDDNSD